MKVLKFLIKLLPLIYMAAIWLLSSKPADHYVEFRFADALIKESLHLIEFAILYLLLALALLTNGKLNKKTNMAVAVFAGFYGVLDEIHQYFVPYRSATIIDVIKDITGVFVCYLFVYRGYIIGKREGRIGRWMVTIENWFI